jgi:uncharacterized protein (DUF2384 family)
MTDSRTAEEKLAETRAELAVALMCQVFEVDQAKQWLTRPQSLLNGASPVDLCATDAGWTILRGCIDQVLESVHV